MPLTLDEYMLRTKEFYRNKGYGFNRDNMEKILSVSNNSMECHSRVFAFRVDFHFPVKEYIPPQFVTSGQGSKLLMLHFHIST